MIALFDFDSVIYKAASVHYKGLKLSMLRKEYLKHLNDKKEWSSIQVNVKGKVKNIFECRSIIEKGIFEDMLTFSENIGDGIISEIDKDPFIVENGIDINIVEYYITVGMSIRKSLVTTYKANRKPKPLNRWVSMVRNHYLQTGFCEIKDGWEADDLIYDRAKELGMNNYIIIALDKDLKQIPGIYFDYYKRTWTESDGYNDFGYKNQTEMRGLTIVNEDQARYLFWTQMLVGDGVDNISGVKGIGKVKAEQILYSLFQKDASDEVYENLVKGCYNDKYGVNGEKEFKKNFFLIKLGVRDFSELM